MVKVCCVKSCKEFWSPNTYLSFFAFPFNNEEMKEKWLDAAPEYKALSKHSSICSKHFLPDDYTTFAGKRMLKKTAVPSVFGPDCPNGCINIPNSILISDELCSPDSLSGEINMKPELINFLKLQLDALPNVSSIRHQGLQRDEVPNKRVSSVSVQTCPRLSGPSEREKELQHKIRILQNRLRRREKMITNVKDLVVNLKKENSSDNLEEKFLKKFTKFHLELFKNEANNNNAAKTSKTYTKEMKEFASTLYSYSPRAYKFVRAKINLPHIATLRRWIAESLSNSKDNENRNKGVEIDELERAPTELKEVESIDAEEVVFTDNETENVECIEMEEAEYDELEEVEYHEMEEVDYNEMEEVDYNESEEVEYNEVEEIEYNEGEEIEYNEVEEVEYNEIVEPDGNGIDELKYSDVKEKLVSCKLPVKASKSNPCHKTLKEPPMTTIPISSSKNSTAQQG